MTGVPAMSIGPAPAGDKLSRDWTLPLPNTIAMVMLFRGAVMNSRYMDQP